MRMRKHIRNFVGNVFRGLAVLLSFAVPTFLMYWYLPQTKEYIAFECVVIVIIVACIGLATRSWEYFEDKDD